MPEPKTNQLMNEAVAKKLGLKYQAWPIPPDPVTKHVFMPEFSTEHIFNPATKPEDALWALRYLYDKFGWAYRLERLGTSQAVTCEIFAKVEFISADTLRIGFGECEDGKEERAICEAIAGAANTERAAKQESRNA